MTLINKMLRNTFTENEPYENLQYHPNPVTSGGCFSCSYRLYRIIGAPEGYRSVNPHFITDLNPN